MHQRGVGIVMFTAEPQERLDIDLFELKCADLPLGGDPIGPLHYGVVNLACLLGLEIVAWWNRSGLEGAGMVVVENKTQRLEFVTQDIDTLERSRFHITRAYRRPSPIFNGLIAEG